MIAGLNCNSVVQIEEAHRTYGIFKRNMFSNPFIDVTIKIYLVH